MNVTVTCTDNRDQGTTWLWINESEYVEVNPVDLMGNMIENCYNEDVLFLFEQFHRYLDKIDEETEDIKEERKTHLIPFAEFLQAVR